MKMVKRNVTLRADQVERVRALATQGNFSAALQVVVDRGLGSSPRKRRKQVTLKRRRAEEEGR